jgi:hypothetical protein
MRPQDASVGLTELETRQAAPEATEGWPVPSADTARGSRILVLVGLGFVVLVFYFVEASLRKTPWLFTDELEWSQLSRAIASTGHAARRTQAHSFESFYSFLIAPFWWIHSTATAYAAIKYVNAVVMSLTVVPVYLLARMLLSRRASLVVALLSIAIPAMAYATSIVPESLAYPWFALQALFAVRLLAAPSVGRAVPAVLLATLGLWVRSEFVALPAALVLAGAIAWIVERGGSWRERWRWIALGCAGLAAFGYLFNVLVVEHVQSWQFGQYFNRHTVHEGGLAAGALAIGLGVGPVVGGLVSLWLPERFGDRNYRAFAIYLLSTIVALWFYTAAKSTYLLTNLRPAIEERNLFYLSPLLLIGTALVLFARRVNWWLVGAATLLVLAMVWSGMFEVGAPYFEAPGLDIVTLTNRYFYWNVNDFHPVLIGAAAIFALLLLFRRRRWVPAVAVVLGAAWLLTGEVYATVGNTDQANVFARMMPAPRNWVDKATHGAHVTFLGQGLNVGANQLWLAEFWNRSIDHVASLDGTAPGPGPTSAPGLKTAEGALSEYTGDPYTLVGNGIELAAPVVAQRDGLVLYSTSKPWHLVEDQSNVWTDGWATNPFTYTYFPRGGPGVVTVQLSRTAWKGPGRPGRATIRVGTVRLDQNGVPQLKQQIAVRHVVVPNGQRRVVRIPVASTPVTVSVVVSNTIHAPGDTRKLAAQPAFSFKRG